jgi:hypothetical protein
MPVVLLTEPSRIVFRGANMHKLVYNDNRFLQTVDFSFCLPFVGQHTLVFVGMSTNKVYADKTFFRKRFFISY